MLQKWRKNEGDKVAPGELFAEVETDKAIDGLRGVRRGALLKRLIADGTTVPVGTPIAILGNPGEDIAALVAEAEARSAARRAAGAAAKPAPAAAAPAAPAPNRPPPRPPAPPSRRRSAPAAAPRATNGQPAPARRRLAPPAAGARAPWHPRVLASPLARRLATDLGSTFAP